MSEIAFIDSETRSLADLPATGAYKYAKHPSTDASVWGFVFDDEPGDIWSPSWAWGNANGTRKDAETPERLLDHVADGGIVVAWNAFFDRHIWNEVMVKKYGWPVLPIEQVLCAQAQAEANNLPGKLEKACECLGTPYRKDPKGRQLIQQLAVNGDRSTWNSEVFETPEKMGHFRSYCLKDCLATRDVWQYTRPLTASEWDEYHASERINDRGVMVDVPFATAAQSYALAETLDINGELLDLTGDPKLTVTNHVRKAKWLHDELWPSEELQELTKRPQKEAGKDRFSGDRATRDAVLEMIMLPEYSELFEDEHLDEIVEFIELIEAGNSAAVRKFTAIVNQEVDARVHGGYSFNGAGQTGRFSSRGIQVHNLIRSPVEKGNPDRAIDAIEDIMNGEDPEFLVDEYGFPVSRLLARLIRPTFIAPEGKTLVWADWDQIEARVLPWLSESQGGDDKLDIFRSGKDVYKYAAQPIFHLSAPEDADDHQRQVGKVAELALGFGGAVGAFSAMGRGYGVIVPPEEARSIVTTWRANNSWCVNFWHELWDAAMAAFNYPGEWYRAGRVRYLYHPNLMRGTLICELPDGRWIVYPQFEHERVQYECKKTTARHTKGEWVDEWRTSFVKGFGGGYGRVDLWYGTLAENITQATAASFLRLALLDLDDCCILHLHDEIVLEVDDKEVAKATARLNKIMSYIPDWATGLPLTASIEHGYFYTK